MADINLLQNQIKDTTLIAQRRSMIVIWIAAFILVLLFLGCGAFYLLTKNVNNQINETAKNNTELQAEIQGASSDLDNAKILQAKLSNVNLLLDKHVYVSLFLDELERVTYQNAKYVSIDMGAEGKVHIEGTVSSYSDLGKLLLGLSTSSNFTDVKLLAVVGAVSDQSAYQFSIEMFINEDLLIKETE